MHCKYSADYLQSISVMYIKDICNGCEKPKICVSILIKFASAYKIYVRFVYTYIGTYVLRTKHVNYLEYALNCVNINRKIIEHLKTEIMHAETLAGYLHTSANEKRTKHLRIIYNVRIKRTCHQLRRFKRCSIYSKILWCIFDIFWCICNILWCTFCAQNRRTHWRFFYGIKVCLNEVSIPL